MIADISTLTQFAVRLPGYLRSAASDPARLGELNRFFNSLEWEDLIESDSSLSRILWSIRNVLYAHEGYGDRVDVADQRASLLALADQLDHVNIDEIRTALGDTPAATR